jgi:hypothetical protein
LKQNGQKGERDVEKKREMYGGKLTVDFMRKRKERKQICGVASLQWTS